MPAAAVQSAPVVAPVIALPVTRRFELPDLDTHAGWLVPRLLELCPHMNARGMASYLRGLLYSPDYLFLFQDNAVALAQVVSEHAMAAQPVLWERFVFAREPKYVPGAAVFYDEFRRWAKMKGIAVMIVEEASDVPHETIKDRLNKRLFTRQQVFARIE